MVPWFWAAQGVGPESPRTQAMCATARRDISSRKARHA